MGVFKLLQKILLLVLLVFFASYLVRSAFPYFWCGPVIANKERIFFDSGNKYKAVFLGSSRINHGIDPEVFDRTYRKLSGKKMRSFNFGISGGSVGEIYQTFIQVLDERPPELEYIVIELASVSTSLKKKFCQDNLHTNRNKYWLDLETLFFSLKNLKDQKVGDDISRRSKLRYGKNYVVNYAENIFNIGMYSGMYSYMRNGYPAQKGVGPKRNGYNNINQLESSGAKRARKSFLKNKDQLVEKKKESVKYFENRSSSDKLNRSYFGYIQDMISRAKQENIKLIFLAPPLMAVDSHEEIFPIIRAIPAENKLNLANAKKYPEFYKAKNIWDGNHLNDKGAKLLSDLLARKLVKKKV